MRGILNVHMESRSLDRVAIFHRAGLCFDLIFGNCEVMFIEKTNFRIYMT
jgi:hypothetical protein